MTISEKIKKAREERRKLAEDMNALSAKAVKENRAMNADEVKEFGDMDKKSEELRKSYEDLERQERAKNLMAETKQKQEEEDKRKEKDEPEERSYKDVFRDYMKRGIARLSEEDRKEMESRALTTQTGTSGGFTIPEGFANTIESYMKLWGGMREIADVITTNTGNPIPYPTEDDTANMGEWLAENTAVSEQDVDFAQKMLNAWTATSKMVRVPIQLLQDSFFNMESFLAEKFARRVGVLTNAAFTTGDGTSKPKGFVIDAEVGNTAAANNAITYDELIDLMHAVDPVYRNVSRWVFNDPSGDGLRNSI